MTSQAQLRILDVSSGSSSDISGSISGRKSSGSGSSGRGRSSNSSGSDSKGGGSSSKPFAAGWSKSAVPNYLGTTDWNWANQQSPRNYSVKREKAQCCRWGPPLRERSSTTTMVLE